MEKRCKMAEQKLPGIHIRDRFIAVNEIVAVDATIGVHHNTDHSHKKAYELIYCARGNMVVQLNETWTDIDSGTCIIVPRDTKHNTVTESDTTFCFYVAFDPSTDISRISGQYIRLPENYRLLLDSLAEELTKGYLSTGKGVKVFTLIPHNEMPAGAEQLALDLLEILLVLITRIVSAEGYRAITKSHNDFADNLSKDAEGFTTDRVTEYIRNHLTEKLTVESIAEHFGYSRSRLSTIYKQNTGHGINYTIANEKLLYARHLLIETDMQVSEIAEYLGFSSPQYFTNRFYRSTGMSPSNYARFKRTKVN